MANSPYMCLSAFAGNPMLVDLQELANRGWLEKSRLRAADSFLTHRVDYAAVSAYRMPLLRLAAENFFAQRSASEKLDFELFCDSHEHWLEDYALFRAINDKAGGSLWSTWEEALVSRTPASLKHATTELRTGILFHKFTQWCFYRQWAALKKYANERGVNLIGDIPIFVAHHSSDVWANPKEFSLDAKGNPTVVAGVPPDYFSDTGQRWGNPLYRWDVIKQEKFKWWIQRFKSSFELFDVIRIDHFRGFVAYWEIPAVEKTAVKGKWVAGPAQALFNAVEKRLGKLPIIAEDLGLMTPEVAKLREDFGFPGMKVLQFAFADGPENAFLPHNFSSNCVVYTGTHDNDTSIGWYQTASEREKDFARRYMNVSGSEINWDLIKLALRSVADIAIIPFQDVLGLSNEHRMNLPGTTNGNWEWRFTWEMVQPFHASSLYEITAMNARCTPDRLGLPSFRSNKRKP